jgi:hypothetical protein
MVRDRADGGFLKSKEFEMAQATRENQAKILKNQAAMLANQKEILANQRKILGNQKKILGR